MSHPEMAFLDFLFIKIYSDNRPRADVPGDMHKHSLMFHSEVVPTFYLHCKFFPLLRVHLSYHLCGVYMYIYKIHVYV